MLIRYMSLLCLQTLNPLEYERARKSIQMPTAKWTMQDLQHLCKVVRGVSGASSAAVRVSSDGRLVFEVLPDIPLPSDFEQLKVCGL